MTTKQIPDETIIRSFIDLAAENGCSVAPEIQRLLIAAPELLETLQRLVAHGSNHYDMKRARSVIAKVANPNAGEVPAFPKGRW